MTGKMRYLRPLALETPTMVRLGVGLRGLAIAAVASIRPDQFGYKVPAQSHKGSYLVNLEYGPYCTCPDFEERQLPCKHVFAVEIVPGAGAARGRLHH